MTQSKLRIVEQFFGAPIVELVEKWGGSYRAAMIINDAPIPNLLVSPRRVRKWVERNRKLFPLYKIPERSSPLKATKAYNELIDYINSQVITLTKHRPSPLSTTRDVEDIALMLSDLHFGKKVEIQGRVVFDRDIAAEMFKRLVANIDHLHEVYLKSGHIIEDIHVFLLGDICDGELTYEGQTWQLELPLLDQVQLAATQIISLAIWAAGKFRQVHFHVVGGNHSADERFHYTTNFDLVAAVMARYGTVHLKNVFWNISLEPYLVVKARGHTYLMRHKIPAQIDTAGGRAKIGGWWQMHKFDVLLTGHYHRFAIGSFNDIRVIYNGNLFGNDDFSESLSFNSSPCQVMFLISDKRPMTLIWPVDLR